MDTKNQENSFVCSKLLSQCILLNLGICCFLGTKN